jgi:1-acyl-sn-glycerol-3-phosphate acyltransferase
VSNHQNTLADALGLVFAIPDRKPLFIARGDIFEISPFISFLLKYLGILPAYRRKFDGNEALKKNDESFSEVIRNLLDGQTVGMYPEGGHQDKRWLGDFSIAYLKKIAFAAAQKDNFQTEIFILPACNHYSDYYNMQEDLLIKFGKPISLKPYYEKFRTTPLAALREVNKAVRESIDSMMLNINDLDNYEALDFLRTTEGVKYAVEHGFNPDSLPEKLQSDKEFVASIEKAYAEDPEKTKKRYDEALKTKAKLKNLKTRYELLNQKPSWLKIILSMLGLTVLLPLFLVALVPNMLIYNGLAFVRLIHNYSDRMFDSSLLFASAVVITIPLFYTLTFVLVAVFVNIWIAVGYLVVLPWLGLFAHRYLKFFRRTWQDFRSKLF